MSTAAASAPSTTATRTVRELIEALTKLAGELPRGPDTPVEVGLLLEDDTFDTTAAFTVEAIAATWPGFRLDGAECRHTTLSLIGDRGHPDADRCGHDRRWGSGPTQLPGGPSMKLRLQGTPAECAKLCFLLRYGPRDLEVVEVSPPYRNRGDSRLVRVYLDVRLPEGLPPLAATFSSLTGPDGRPLLTDAWGNEVRS